MEVLVRLKVRPEGFPNGSPVSVWSDADRLSLSVFFLVVLLLVLPSCLPKHQKGPIPPEGELDTTEKCETRGVQYGMASWYGPDFHGKPTTSGEIYDMFQLSCAHNSLPLGTTVIVTNLENGKSLELKVNDRGPFAKGRIIDLSYAAARILGIWEKGTAFCKVETVAPRVEQTQKVTLQVGSFTNRTRALRLADDLRKSFEHVRVTPVETSLHTYYRVRIGPFDTRELARNMAEQVSRMGYQVLMTSR